ncbi:hypothetical protein VTK56DRAFT_9725 [Thermocarpiscus australiensis]
MEFKKRSPGLDSPAFAQSAKRGHAEALEETPAAERAKRVKKRKNRASKDGRVSDGYIEQNDWVSFDSTPVFTSSKARQATPVKPPTPFRLKLEKWEDDTKDGTKKKGRDINRETNEGPKYPVKQNIRKIEERDGKTMPEQDLKGDGMRPVKKDDREDTEAVASSKTERKRTDFPTEETTGLSPKHKPSPMTASPAPSEAADQKSNEFEGSFTPTGSKTLKAINKRLKSLDAKLSSTPPDLLTQDMHSLRGEMTQLQQRLQCDELRATIRHEMLFNALVKVSTDVGALSRQLQLQLQLQKDDAGETAAAATPGAASAAAKEKHKAGLKQSRKTLEQCLRIYSEDMNKASSADEVKKLGSLCVQYAGDLFKTLG